MLSPVQKLRQDRKNGLAKEIANQVISETGGKEILKGASSAITFLAAATIICLIGATIPHMTAYRVFGFFSLAWLILLLLASLTYYKHFKRKIIKAVSAVAITMLLTGCSGFFVPDFSETTPLIEYLHQADREYKTGHAGGVGFFGFGLYDATVEAAMTNGNITKAYAAETNNSFGWVAVVKVKVYGE